MTKYKLVTAGALALFVAVNTEFIWETWLDIFLIPLTLLMGIAFLLLVVLTIVQASICLYRERLGDRSRLLHCMLSATSLVLVILFPLGIFDREMFRGTDLLVASSEGAANCTTTLRLKDDGEFYVRSICFGVTETAGKYEYNGDTIRFNDDEEYEFAVVRPADSNEPYSLPTLIRFKNRSDTVGHELLISVNHLDDM